MTTNKNIWLVAMSLTLVVGLTFFYFIGDSEGAGGLLIVMCLGISGLLSEEPSNV